MGLRNRQPVWALPVGPFDIIGMAKFNTISNITLLSMWGCISRVEFVSLSLVNIFLWPPVPVSQYIISGSASSDATNATFVAINTANGVAHTATGFQIQMVGVNPLTGKNSGIVHVNIHGRIPSGA